MQLAGPPRGDTNDWKAMAKKRTRKKVRLSSPSAAPPQSKKKRKRLVSSQAVLLFARLKNQGQKKKRTRVAAPFHPEKMRHE